MEYQDFLKTKGVKTQAEGIRVLDSDINPILFPFQRAITKWSLLTGRSAIFANTGLGKTFMYLEWARLIPGHVLIVAPLSVAFQVIGEAEKLGIKVNYAQNTNDVMNKITITNYERVTEFNPGFFDGIVLDESSILKNLMGKTKQLLIDMFQNTPYRLCSTATPAPNDLAEIGNHAEFLGICTGREMKSTYFTYYSNKTSNQYRLKKHAHKEFYKWMASWSMSLMNPSDLGFDDTGYDLPPINIELHTIQADYNEDGVLPGFEVGGINPMKAKRIRRQTIAERLELAKDLVNGNDEQWVIWGGLNDETNALKKSIDGSVNVWGMQKPEVKMSGIRSFLDKEKRVLITKTKIAGFGLNLQQCHNMVFFGIDYSWESYYQAIRRIYRFGQTEPVNIHIIISEQSRPIFDSLQKKEQEAMKMSKHLVEQSSEYARDELSDVNKIEVDYKTNNAEGEGWKLMLGDSTERLAEIPDDSIDLSIYSPPFGSEIFVYSPTPRDVGNSTSMGEFFVHYEYIIDHMLRVTKPGRLTCVHVADMRNLKGQNGFIGRKDFSGDVIRAYEQAGWTYWHRISINKNPQAQAIRRKDHGLLFKTMRKDATMLNGGAADYVLIFKKPGENKVPVLPIENGEMTENDWIRDAAPLWTDINETDVLNTRNARANEDEKHMCPLQLPVIRRLLKLWSNPGETILSPFAGIGSEGYEALRWGRNFTGIELKESYFEVAKINLANAESVNGMDLFAWAKEQEQSNLIEVENE